ncbi:MAG: hypothetical protein JW716_03105 [Candidatus Aenigmarchaeota archaeon]|nr:hypothetical protein [Candidatus Aenigmarchaeota archaeon]
MSEESVIKLFLQNDILLKPEEFIALEKKNHKDFLEEKLREKRGLTNNGNVALSKGGAERGTTTPGDHIKPKQPEEGSDIEIKVLGELKEIDKKKINVMDIVSVYNKKYNEVRDILSERTTSLSINKTENNKDRVSVIGIISQKTDNGLTIEDETGALNVIYSGNGDIENDDVVAVSGLIKNNSMFAEDVILPDIPLDNIQKIISAEISFDFSKSDSIDIEGKKIKVKNASLFSVRKGKEEMKILFYRTNDRLDKGKLINFLRKRSIRTEENTIPSFLIIKEVPDLFVVSSAAGEKTRTNYKSVTIISTGLEDKIKLGKSGF